MADTKNFGLKGVGNDIQLGKAGSRINLSGTSIQARNAADGAYVIVKALDPVADVDLATKLYVDNVAAGLDPKESCTCATTGAGVGTYAAGGGAAGNGAFSAVGAIDGDFGPKTEKAVKGFQKVAGLPANGRVNAAVWEALENEA